MTKPKSRSIWMSLAISTAKPAIAVTAGGEDGRAGARVGAPQRRLGPAPAAALLVEAAGEDHAELGRDRDRQRPQRRRHRVERDAGQPEDQRGPAGRQHGRHQRHQGAGERAVDGEQRQGDREQPGQGQPVAAGGEVGGRFGGDHRQAGELDLDPGRRAARRARLADLGRGPGRSAPAGPPATGRGCRSESSAWWPTAPVSGSIGATWRRA